MSLHNDLHTVIIQGFSKGISINFLIIYGKDPNIMAAELHS